MNFKTSKLGLLAFIMVVNALSYGTIVPLLYPYASRFGIGPLGISILFATYSLAQFLATPFLGRLSDRYGRKPILLICILGTAASLAVMAVSGNVWIFAIGRFIDGVTGGNISVAQAIISDTTKGEERAKGFGMLGAAFGIGFLVGPAIGGLLGGISLTAPFWFSALLALVGAVLGFFLLPETLPRSARKSDQHEPLFKFDSLIKSLFTPFTGVVLLISFIWAAALNMMFLGFQTFTSDVLKLGTLGIGLLFSLFALTSILMQFFGISSIMKRFRSKKTVFVFSTLLSAVALFSMYLSRSVVPFFLASIFFAAVSAFRDPLLAALLTERTSKDDQGEILGVNQSYLSLGQIIGPILAGLIAHHSVSRVFLFSAGLLLIAVGVSRFLYLPVKQKVNL